MKQENEERSDPFVRIKRRRALFLLALLALLACTVFISILIGEIGPIGAIPGGDNISIGDAVNILLGQPHQYSDIIWDIRVPRIILAGFVGAGLAAAGMAMQAVFRNSMADPFIIGVSSGAAVGAAAVSLFGVGGMFMLFTQPILAFVGAIITVFVVYRLGTIRGHVYVDTLLLSGVAVAAFLGAITSFMIYVQQQQFHQLAHWLLGSLQSASWTEVEIIALPIVAGGIVIYLYGRELNVLLLGEEAAHNLGGNPEFLKKVMLAVAAIMTSVAVAFTGIIGFVGLMVPHMMRLIVGSDHRLLAPASVLGGAIFLIWADAISRSFVSLPVGVITALFGGPFFLFLLRSRRLRGEGR
jgi:iron complex transport system permease protein